MTKRILLATLLGGVAMYAWSSIAHMLLPLGETGIKDLPNEAAVMSTLQSNLGSSRALYLFPGMGLPPGATGDQIVAAQRAYGQKLATAPMGLLIYNPPGAIQLGPALYITEFVVELAEVFLAVLLLAAARPASYGRRVLFVAGIGLIAVLTTNVSYWNWYGFPTSYTVAYMFTQFVGFVCAGLVAAAFVKESSAPARRVAVAA